MVSETENGPTDTLTSRAASMCEVQVRVPDDAAGGSAGSPDAITVCLAGAMTVRSTSIASLVALSAGKLIMSSVCQPKPRCQASSGSAEPK